MAKQMKGGNTEEKLAEAFHVFDRDKNGLISIDSLKRVMGNLGLTSEHKTQDKLTEEDLEELIKYADMDEDGFISYEEFVKVIMVESDPQRRR